jgi:hypothetical protein
MAEITPKMGSQTRARRMVLVSGSVAWACEMDEDIRQDCSIFPTEQVLETDFSRMLQRAD